MKENFDLALRALLKLEGGYVNHPADPGGATNKGVTQAVYDDWRAARGLMKQSVRLIAPPEVSAIYRKQYWDAVSGDKLPSGLDYAVFDFAVNSGVNISARPVDISMCDATMSQTGVVPLSRVKLHSTALSSRVPGTKRRVVPQRS